MLRKLRGEVKAAESYVREAEVERDQASAEAENLRELLQTQETDSGKITAYEEAIRVC